MITSASDASHSSIAFSPRATLLVALLSALPSCRPLDAGPDVQRALTVYAPDLILGAPVSVAARQRYHLKIEPYLGYRDSAYRTLDGVHNLGIGVDEYVDDGNPRVSAKARVKFVQLSSPDSLSSRRVESRLRAMLGEPREECYADRMGGPWRSLYWPGAHGHGVVVVVLLPRKFNPPALRTGITVGGAENVRIGASALTFGGDEPDNRNLQLVRCP